MVGLYRPLHHKDVKPHNFDEGVVTTTPTETVEGIKLYTCEDCGYSYEENMGVLEHVHTYEEAWSYDETHHWHKSTCGHEAKDYGQHTGGEATTTQKAICEVCGQPYGELKEEFDKLIQQNAYLIIVTNEIGLGGVSPDEIQRKFTDLQGWMNQYIASKADEVILRISGIPLKVK